LNSAIIHYKGKRGDDKTAVFTPVEPLMLSVIQRYLEDKGITMVQLTVNWMKDILQRLNNGEVEAVKKRGFPPEVLLACALLQVAKEINGQPITTHPLFVHLSNTYLNQYTLLATKIQRDIDGMLWQDIFQRRRVDLLLLPKDSMRPDLFGHLCAISNRGDVIPLTAGVKITNTAFTPNELSSRYLDNLKATDVFKAFMQKDGETVNPTAQTDYAILQPLLKSTYVHGEARALRLLFTYNPCQIPIETGNGQYVEVFDNRNEEFQKLLSRMDDEVLQLLSSFIEPLKKGLGKMATQPNVSTPLHSVKTRNIRKRRL